MIEKTIIGWKIWAIDLPNQKKIETYISQETKWINLPKDGILAIVLFESTLRPDNFHTKRILKGSDYYFKALTADNNEIFGSDIDNRERNILKDISERYLHPIVLKGIWTTDENMYQVEREILLSEMK